MMKMNKVIAAMVMMAMTVAMPAMAGNRHHNHHNHHHNHHDKNVVVVVHHKGGPHFDKRAAHFDRHYAPRPEMRICAVYLSRFDSPRAAMERAERIHGVAEVKYNPRTREITVLYDAKVTSSRHIRHAVA
jgi:hypothetical protein